MCLQQQSNVRALVKTVSTDGRKTLKRLNTILIENLLNRLTTDLIHQTTNL